MNKSQKRPKARGNGQGSVFKDRDKYRWQLRKEVKGQMVVVAQGRELTKTAAEKARACAVADWDRGLLAVPVSITVGEWLERWLELRRPHIRDTTYDQYEVRLRVHVPNDLRRMALQDVKRMHILNLEASLVSKLCASSRKKVIEHLAAAFQEAVHQEILVRNPATDIKVSKSVEERNRPRRRKALTDDEMHTFLHIAEGEEFYPIFYTMFSLGLRCGEVLGLRWQDYDVERQTVEITQAVRLHRNRPLIGEPKSRSAYRGIPIGGDLVEVLERHRALQNDLKRSWGEAWPATGLIFTTTLGTVLDRHNVYRTIHRLCDRAGLQRFGTHAGRHTNLTNRMRQGQPAEVVSKIAGHARPSITLDIYRHVMPDELRSAAYDLSAQLRRSAETLN